MFTPRFAFFTPKGSCAGRTSALTPPVTALWGSELRHGGHLRRHGELMWAACRAASHRGPITSTWHPQGRGSQHSRVGCHLPYAASEEAHRQRTMEDGLGIRGLGTCMGIEGPCSSGAVRVRGQNCFTAVLKLYDPMHIVQHYLFFIFISSGKGP